MLVVGEAQFLPISAGPIDQFLLWNDCVSDRGDPRRDLDALHTGGTLAPAFHFDRTEGRQTPNKIKNRAPLATEAQVHRVVRVTQKC